jgi:hypothetical protein
MRDEEQQLEEIEAPHTLIGAREVARGEGSGEGVDTTRVAGTRHASHQGAGRRGNKERKCVCVCVCVKKSAPAG